MPCTLLVAYFDRPVPSNVISHPNLCSRFSKCLCQPLFTYSQGSVSFNLSVCWFDGVFNFICSFSWIYWAVHVLIWFFFFSYWGYIKHEPHLPFTVPPHQWYEFHVRSSSVCWITSDMISLLFSLIQSPVFCVSVHLFSVERSCYGRNALPTSASCACIVNSYCDIIVYYFLSCISHVWRGL